jgi:hypothetical protein
MNDPCSILKFALDKAKAEVESKVAGRPVKYAFVRLTYEVITEEEGDDKPASMPESDPHGGKPMPGKKPKK